MKQIVFIFVLATLLLGSCSPAKNVVSEVRTDTLHVYHTDTIYRVANDTTIREVIKVVHDSIIFKTIVREVIDKETGEIISKDSETNKEVYSTSDTNSALIRHTVDSLLKARIDSVYSISEGDKQIVVEVDKRTWWDKIRNAVQAPFTLIGLIVCLCVIIWLFIRSR